MNHRPMFFAIHVPLIDPLLIACCWCFSLFTAQDVIAGLSELPGFLSHNERWLAEAVAQLALKGCGRQELHCHFCTQGMLGYTCGQVHCFEKFSVRV